MDRDRSVVEFNIEDDLLIIINKGGRVVVETRLSGEELRKIIMSYLNQVEVRLDDILLDRR